MCVYTHPYCPGRWYCEVDPDAMEVPISPDVLLDCHAIEGLAFPAPGPADLAPPETPTTPTLLLPHTASALHPASHHLHTCSARWKNCD